MLSAISNNCAIKMKSNKTDQNTINTQGPKLRSQVAQDTVAFGSKAIKIGNTLPETVTKILGDVKLDMEGRRGLFRNRIHVNYKQNQWKKN